jgi:hypothetical protein
MRKSLAHVVCQGLSVGLVGVLVVGCQKADQSSGGPPPPTTVRHDVAGLVEKFPALGEPASVAWVTWGDDSAETSAEWNVEYLDAVVRLTPLATNALITITKPTDTGRVPQVQEILRSEVPAGPFLTSDGLDLAFGSNDASTYAYLDRGNNALVLQSTGVGA